MNERLRFLVRQHGYCCVYAYIYATISSKEVVVAAELGITPRTIRNWRAKFRRGTLRCASAAPCFISKLGESPLPSLASSSLQERVD
jgi:transposase-like protein